MAPLPADQFDNPECITESSDLHEIIENDMAVQSRGDMGEFPCLGFAICLSSATRSAQYEAGYTYYGHAENVEDPERQHEWFDASKSQINIQSMIDEVCRARVMIQLIFDNDNYPKVQSDTVVSKLWPEFGLSKESFTNAVTIDDLICHISGLPDPSAAELGLVSFDRAAPNDLLAALRTMEIRGNHRERYGGSYLGSFLVELLINRLTGGRYEELRARTCGWPVRVEEEEGVTRARRYEYTEVSSEEVEWREVPVAPSSDTFATVLDLHQLAENLFRPERGFTSAEKLAEMVRTRLFEGVDKDDMTSVGAAFSWYTHEILAPGVQIIARQMESQGYGCAMFFFPENNLVLTAVGTHDNAESIAWDVGNYVARRISEASPE